MGITGLIPFLEKASEKTNVRDLPRGTCVAIDSYCWLHKGAFACADLLARGASTDIHIQYCLKYVKMLLGFGIKPVMVFDGRHLPAKALTEAKRRETRKNAKARAAELMQLGKHEEARTQLRRCIDITHEMALALIQECRAKNVDCIVAPYEADGQLAYLNAIGLADYVITEDSDLILFGCKKILFKLDLTGSCLFVDAAKLHLAMGCSPERFTFEKFRFMCIMSGCDYLDSLPGIGLAKSCKFVLKTEEEDVKRALAKIPVYLNMRNLEVTDEYKESFLRANATFQHMLVFDPRKRKLVHLSDPEKAGTDMKYCCNAGEFFDERLAFQMALGNIDPFTLKQLDDWSPDDRPKLDKGSHVAKHRSMWQSESTQSTSNDQDKPKNTNESVRQFIRFRDAPVHDPTPTDQPEDIPDDLLTVYGRNAISSPVAKRPKNFHFDPLETSPNLARNPFGVVPKIESLTKICDSNRSLILQCKPVKRIVFATDPASPVKRRLDTKFGGGKLRLKQTVLDEKQKVLSRFFQANANLVAKQEADTSSAQAVADQVADLERRTAEREANVMYSEVEAGRRSTGSTNMEEDEAENSPQKTIDLTILDEVPKSPKRTIQNKPKSTARQPGLSRNAKNAAGRVSDHTQSRLSMFGFKKKTL